jgi:chromosome segregation ATPase
MFGFVRALAAANGQKAIQRVTDAIVDLDPATASEAQLHMMEQSLDHVGVELAKFRAEAAREHSDAFSVQQRFDRMKTAGEALNTQWTNETDPDKKTSLEKSLNGLLTTMEGIKTELDQHNQEAVDGDKLVAETEEIYQQKAEELKSAKDNLAHAARDLEAAHMAQEHAAEQAEHAAEVAGLRNDKIDGLNAALTSMQRQTAEAKADADAKRMKADVLTHAEAGGMDDPNVKAALASVAATSTSSQSFADRLAALHS